MGTAYALRDDGFHAAAALAAFLGALLIQVGTNLANDYYDHRRGADRPGRVGPPRATAMGWIRPSRVLLGASYCFGAAAAVGFYLVLHAGWPILWVGLVALASGYAYTGGPYPLGYHGWGDAFVFVFFGLVAVAGTYYVQAGPAPLDVVVGAVPIGALATAILVVNNLRDLEPDRAAGKRTLAVRLGARATRWEYTALLLAAYVAPLAMWAAFDASPLVLLPELTLPFAAHLVHRIRTVTDSRALNPLLPRTAGLLAAYGLLLGLGVAA